MDYEYPRIASIIPAQGVWAKCRNSERDKEGIEVYEWVWYEKVIGYALMQDFARNKGGPLMTYVVPLTVNDECSIEEDNKYIVSYVYTDNYMSNEGFHREIIE